MDRFEQRTTHLAEVLQARLDAARNTWPKATPDEQISVLQDWISRHLIEMGLDGAFGASLPAESD